MCMEMMWGMWGMGGIILAAVFWLVTIDAVGAGAWWIVRQVRPASRDSALDILRERYARGEIPREEFEARRRDLTA